MLLSLLKKTKLISTFPNVSMVMVSLELFSMFTRISIFLDIPQEQKKIWKQLGYLEEILRKKNSYLLCSMNNNVTSSCN